MFSSLSILYRLYRITHVIGIYSNSSEAIVYGTEYKDKQIFKQQK